MRTLARFGALALLAMLPFANIARAQADRPVPPRPAPAVTRELLVPFDDLNLLLDDQTQRVLLSRQEYEELAARTQKATQARAPVPAALVSADYAGQVEVDRVRLRGELVVDVLEEGTHALPLELSGVGLRSATLAGKGAPIGRDERGRLLLFVQGKGRQTLTLELVAPLQTAAAQQSLNFRVPTPAATRLRLEAAGDVNVRGGAAVVSRTFDETARVTLLELLPRAGEVSLVMTLNGRLQRAEQSVVARGVIVDEVTQAYERLHVSMSMAVLHRPVDRFRFAIPDGFDVTDVDSPLMARWAIEPSGKERVLSVFLREPTTQTAVLTLSALRTPAKLEGWRLPRLEPLDVSGYVAVVGLAVEDRLDAGEIAASGMIPIDTAVLAQALPPTVLASEPGLPRIRPVAAYYAPHAGFGLTARFERPPAEWLATTNLLLILEEKGQRVRGGFAVQARAESLFAFDFTEPKGWHVDAVTDAAGAALGFERHAIADGPARLRVRLPRGLPAGQSFSVLFDASSTPVGWLGEWPSAEVAFPAFGVIGAARDTGAIAVDARDDLTIRPVTLENLSPLDDSDKPKFGLAGVPGALGYRYESRPFVARFVAERTLPRVTAETYSLYTLDHEALRVHSEITYVIERARTQRLALSVPAGAPAALSIQGLDGVTVKETFSEMIQPQVQAQAAPTATAPAGAGAQARRRWNVLLSERRSGTVRLSVDYQVRLPALPLKGYLLPSTRAEEVAYQSGRMAVEGSPELDVGIVTHPRKIDVGELAGAMQQPGDRLLGVFGHLGEKDELTLNAERPPGYALPAVIVQNALLTTALSRDGLIQTNARFELVSKASFLAVSLPANSTLWAVLVDNKPAKPQREGQNLLLSLPPAPEGTHRRLHLVYETPIARAGFWSHLDVPAPRLLVPGVGSAPATEAPVADLRWRVFLPQGYQAVRAAGTLTTDGLDSPRFAAAEIGQWLLDFGGGVTSPLGFLPGLGAARKTSNQMKNSSQVRGIHQALVIFAQSNNTYLAPDVATLIEGSFIAPATLFDASTQVQIPPDIGNWPREKRNQWYNLNTSYVYLRGLRDDANGQQIVLFTKPSRSDGKGLSIAWGDNHVSYVPMDEARQLIVAQTGHTPEEIEQIDEGVARGETDIRAMIFAPPQQAEEFIKTPAVEASRYWILINGSFIKPELLLNEKDALAVGNENAAAAKPAAASARPAERPTGSSAGAPAVSRPAGMPRPTIPARRDMLGADSLTIRLDPQGSQLGFESMGTDPRLSVAVVERERLNWLAWALALGVGLLGVALTRRRVRVRAGYVLGVIAAATVIPMLFNRDELLYVLNGPAYAAALLVPYYLAAGLAFKAAGALRRRFAFGAIAPAGSAAAVLIASLLMLSPALAAPAAAAEGDYNQDGPTPPALKVPADALILPYDPESRTGVKDAGKVLVPFTRFVELWNLAHPDKKLGAIKPPAPFAFAGASYAAALEGDQHLLLRGQVDIEVYATGQVAVPLPLAGGVLAEALVDGKPARLNLATSATTATPPGEKPNAAAASGGRPVEAAPLPPAGDRSLIVLYIDQPGRHRLDISVRLALQRSGGWLAASGRVPSAPATALNLRVPAAQTEVHIGNLSDRSQYETAAADESIATALGDEGTINLRWRPKVGEGQVDQTLTARSSASADIQEDGLHLTWKIDFEFRRGERTAFDIQLPADALVEKVEGANVRGWETRRGGEATTLAVTLLKPARDRESFTITLWQRGPIPGEGKSVEALKLTGLAVPGASLHGGALLLRRSSLLELRTTRTQGVTRADPSGEAGAALSPSPLGLVDFQAYQFAATPFVIELEAMPVGAQVSAQVQSLLKFGERDRVLEGRVMLNVQSRPIYVVRLALPENLRLDQVSAPGLFERSLSKVDGRSVLTLRFAQGQKGSVPIMVRGPLGEPQTREVVALPVIEPLDVASRDSTLVVQTDPAFDVTAEDLKNCRIVPLEQAYGWLDPQQRRSARVALRGQSGEPAATLRLVARKPEAVCNTLTNVRVTDRVVEETILLDFVVRYAGIRQIDFLLPAALADATITVPQLREKSVTSAEKEHPGMVRVRLALQEELMGQVRVLVASSRLRTESVQRASIPIIETGRTERRYVALEGTGRDEVTVEKLVGLEPIDRQQKERRWLDPMLGEGMADVWAVTTDAADPSLLYRTLERAAVETKGARIGLAQLTLAMDESGAYRAEQVYYVDNATEQFIDVELPAGASLWSAKVAGQPVKPVLDPASSAANAGRRARVPLIKTAPGSPSYIVALKYAGSLPRPGGLKRIEFPLLRSVNINVELSQARLYLPPSLRWMRFEGTMRQTQDEGDLVAGEAEYLNRELASANRDMDNSNFYVQSRGRFRYEALKQDINQNMRKLTEFRDNANGAAALVSNKAILERVEQQAKNIEKATTLTQTTINNSIRINQYVGGQRTEHARNQVQNENSNFFDTGREVDRLKGAAQTATPATQPAAAGAPLGEWLARNGLRNDNGQLGMKPGESVPPPAQPMGGAGRGYGGSFQAGVSQGPTSGGRSGRDGQALQQGGNGRYGVEPRTAPTADMPNGPAVNLSDGRDAANSNLGDRKAGGWALDEASKKAIYSQQLKEQTQRQAAAREMKGNGEPQASTPRNGPAGAEQANDVGGATGQSPWSTTAGDWRGGVAWGDNHVSFELGNRLTTTTIYNGIKQTNDNLFATNAAANSSGSSATGLASLDVEVPIRGVAYRFTTPRGQVEISARAVSRSFVSNLMSLAGALAAVVVALVMIRLGIAKSARLVTGRRGANAMLVLGLLAMLLGIMPVYGLLLLIVGVVLRVRVSRFVTGVRTRAATGAN